MEGTAWARNRPGSRNLDEEIMMHRSEHQLERGLLMRREEWICSVLVGFALVAVMNILPGQFVQGLANWFANNNARFLGLWVEKIAGEPIGTDISVIVGQAAATFDADVRAYASVRELVSQLGISWDVSHASPSLPLQLPLYAPLVLLPYAVWDKLWASASVVFLAWSLRLLGVGRSHAYGIAVVFSITASGYFAVSSNYNLLALLIAASWAYRDRQLIQGLALGVYGSGRGVGLLMLAQPLLMRRFRAISWAVLLLAMLGVLVAILEPGIFKDFFQEGLASARFQLERLDNWSIPALLRRAGISTLATLIILVIFATVAFRKAPLFWVLNWLLMAASPIAWAYTVAQGIPLLAFLWFNSRLGKMATLAVVTGVTVTDYYYGVVWPIFVIASGLGLLGCRDSEFTSLRPPQ